MEPTARIPADAASAVRWANRLAGALEVGKDGELGIGQSSIVPELAADLAMQDLGDGLEALPGPKLFRGHSC